MAMPVISATLNKASYVPGEMATLTVVYSDSDSSVTSTITVRGQDSQGNQALVTVQLTMVDKLNLTVTDDSGRVWTLQSDDGGTAVFTATI
jgi:hypothetical protein